MLAPEEISVHDVHFWHGFSVGPFLQFKDFAKIRAVEVFPMPRGPVNKYACAMRLDFMAFLRVVAIKDCPTISSKLCGLYFLANTI